MKIAILGTSGSGKSTLAKRLGETYGLPVLHMDTVHFLPGWVERPFAEEEALSLIHISKGIFRKRRDAGRNNIPFRNGLSGKSRRISPFSFGKICCIMNNRYGTRRKCAGTEREQE